MNFITENNGVYLVKIKSNFIESNNECKNIYSEGPQKKKKTSMYIKVSIWFECYVFIILFYSDLEYY